MTPAADRGSEVMMSGPVSAISARASSYSQIESAEVPAGELVCSAAPSAPAPLAQASGSGAGAAQLVKEHAAQRDCTAELVKMGAAGLAVAGSTAAMVAATPTVVGVLPSILGFISSSSTLGLMTAQYLDCRDGPFKVTPAVS